ncbi:MAG: hypothetical protein LBJ94_01025 [Puniceicoccales bacterium]|nr:hypothetical protein [Puniceicoccales bacterium]
MSYFFRKSFCTLKRHYRKRGKVRFVGREYFFIDEVSFEKPLKSNRDLEHFARLRVEAVSPFSLADVSYGFFAAGPKVTIFIAYKRRIEQFFSTEDSYIFPDFFPSMVVGHDLSMVRARVNRDDSIVFHCPEGYFCLDALSPIVFNANLKEFKQKSHAKFLRKFSKFLDHGIRFCLIGIGLLLLAWGIFFCTHLKFGRFKMLLDGREAEVARIISKHAFLEHISKFYSQENFCLTSLETLNRVRPDDILFTDVHCDVDKKTLKIKGYGQSVGSVENYRSAVRSCANVTSAETSNVHFRDNRAFFTIHVPLKQR